MNYQQIIPVTEARPILGRLVENLSIDSVIGLTKGGRVMGVVISPNYLNLLQANTKKVLSKTFIDETTSPYIRDFTDEEIKEWLKEDALVP
ncbi:hypothetical protein HZB69_04160 [Candidatus Amesbacteria bacterium]|nr:hypothetical protein [Candidatus Amesbacteria bacterium]